MLAPTSSAAHLAVPALLQAAPEGGSPANMFLLLGGMVLILYLVVIRPERKERARKEQMLAALEKNDRVLLTSGLYATVAAVGEADVTLKFDDGPTRVRALRTSIATVVDGREKQD